MWNVDRGLADRAPPGYGGSLRKLAVQRLVMVDNVAAEQDGGLSCLPGEPFSETTNDEFKASVLEHIDSVDTMIRGANTYLQAGGYRPYTETRASTARGSTPSAIRPPPPGAQGAGRQAPAGMGWLSQLLCRWFMTAPARVS